MKINFHLNGKPVEMDYPAETRLSDILKDNSRINSIRAVCNKGECKSCSVLFNGDIVLSCLIPAFEARNSTIVTLEGFIKTKEYNDIVRALVEAETELCDLCRSGTILTIHSILERYAEPEEDQILDAFRGKVCPCTNEKLIIKAIKKAALYRRRIRFGRK